MRRTRRRHRHRLRICLGHSRHRTSGRRIICVRHGTLRNTGKNPKNRNNMSGAQRTTPRSSHPIPTRTPKRRRHHPRCPQTRIHPCKYQKLSAPHTLRPLGRTKIRGPIARRRADTLNCRGRSPCRPVKVTEFCEKEPAIILKLRVHSLIHIFTTIYNLSHSRRSSSAEGRSVRSFHIPRAL